MKIHLGWMLLHGDNYSMYMLMIHLHRRHSTVVKLCLWRLHVYRGCYGISPCTPLFLMAIIANDNNYTSIMNVPAGMPHALCLAVSRHVMVVDGTLSS